MSKENYDSILPELEAIPDEEVKAPAIPVDVYVQEAADLAVWVEGDKILMENAGLDWSLAAGLTVRAGALRHAQSVWAKEFNMKEEARREWEEKSPAAYELKDDLEDTCRFAFHGRPDLLAKVQAIEEGSGDADMIQDLSDLAALAKANLGLVEGVGTGVEKLDLAESTATEMSRLLALMNGESASQNAAKVMRDRAYTHLKKAVDEVRRTGKYVFRKNEEKLKGFYSAYYRKLKQRQKAANSTDTSADDKATE